MLKAKSKWFFMIFWICFLAGLSIVGWTAEIHVTTDRNPVNENESFQIVFSADDDVDGEPDFSPLSKDFDILNQSHSSQASWVNGSFTKMVKWVVDVMPKRSGILEIPAIRFGRDQSRTTKILVKKVDSTEGELHSGEDLFLVVEVSASNPYVQQQVIYTMRLYRKVSLAQASLTEPTLDDAVIERLGEDKDFNTLFQGENYSVTERKYAIFPQKSGIMTIKPLSLTASVVVDTQRRFGGFFSRPVTRTRRVVSDAIELNVKPIPKGFTGKHWLPVEQLYLKDQWSRDNLQVKVGEPLTRTLTLLAKGATVGQLPHLLSDDKPIKSDLGDELKIYPDQPVLKDRPEENSMLAFREEKVALIPSQAGTYQLPAIEITWWNVKKDQMEIEKIPAKTIQAIAATGVTKTKQPKEPEPDETNEEIQLEPRLPTPSETDKFWMVISGFFALGWLLSIFYFYKKLQKQNFDRQKDNLKEPIDDSIKLLSKACKENDKIAAKDALIRWGRQRFGVSSLGQIASFCSDDLKKEILALNQLLYGRKDAQWHGNGLWKAFNQQMAESKTDKQENDKLEPLFRL
jgi:hypothetical protein